jgi:hypothetical protein
MERIILPLALFLFGVFEIYFSKEVLNFLLRFNFQKTKVTKFGFWWGRGVIIIQGLIALGYGLDGIVHLIK